VLLCIQYDSHLEANDQMTEHDCFTEKVTWEWFTPHTAHHTHFNSYRHALLARELCTINPPSKERRGDSEAHHKSRIH